VSKARRLRWVRLEKSLCLFATARICIYQEFPREAFYNFVIELRVFLHVIQSMLAALLYNIAGIYRLSMYIG